MELGLQQNVERGAVGLLHAVEEGKVKGINFEFRGVYPPFIVAPNLQ